MRSLKLDPAVRHILEGLDALGGPPLEDLQIPGPGGALTLRIYAPEGEASARPGFVYFHGGGWVVCNLDSHDNICRALARRAGAVGIAVDYRLSPEAKFPAAIE